MDSWLTLWGMTTTRPRRPTPSARRSTISPFDALRATLDAASARLESRLNQLDLILDVPISDDPRAELALLRRCVLIIRDAVAEFRSTLAAGSENAPILPGPSGAAG